MAYNTRRLIREGNPPTGQLASPVPQYWNPGTEAFEDVLGEHGAPRAILYGPNGQPISSSNRLPVADQATADKLEEARALLETLSGAVSTSAGQTAIKAVLDTIAGKDFATEATLATAVTRLENILSRLESTLDIADRAERKLGEVTFPTPQEVTLTGRTVTIGGTPYELDPPRTLYGPAGSRPDAAAAHAAVPYAVYVSVDTKVIEMTDGTAWRRWGVL